MLSLVAALTCLAMPTSAQAHSARLHLSHHLNHHLNHDANLQLQAPVLQVTSTPQPAAGTQAAVSDASFTRHRVIWGLAIPGVVAFGVSYIANVFFTALVDALTTTFHGDRGKLGWGYVPLVGPFVQATERQLLEWCLVDGIVQVIGVTLMIFGFVGREESNSYVEHEGLQYVAPFAANGTVGLLGGGRF